MDARTHADARAAAEEGYTLTVEEAAAHLHKSPDTIRRYIRDGKLLAQRITGKHTHEYRINPTDLQCVHARTQAHAYVDARIDLPARADVSALVTLLNMQADALVEMAARLEAQNKTLDRLAKVIDRLAEERDALWASLDGQRTLLRTPQIHPAAEQSPALRPSFLKRLFQR